MIQKIFRIIDTLELVSDGTALDRLNRAEKRLLIPSAKQFAEIKLLRNFIVHEYEPDEYTRIFKDVLQMASHLLETADKTISYCKKFL